MNSAKKIDKEISHYLTLLNERQKEAVLTVVKTFAEESVTSVYSDEWKKELDSRYEEYQNGGELINEEEANKRIKAIINSEHL
jgi:hypothetical protein